MDTKKMVIGLDLGTETTQICVKREGQEPESISIAPGNDRYLIPTVLCMRNDTKDWLFGEEAIRCRNREAGVFIDRLLERVNQDEGCTIMDVEISAQTLLERFIRKLLIAVRQRYLQDNLERIVVTVREPNEKLNNVIFEALEQMGIQRERAAVLSHLQSFMYYSVCQKKELWANDVALFDFDKKGLFYYQLTTSRRIAPIAVSAKSADLTDLLDESMLETMPEDQLAYSFRTITDKVTYRQILSTIYATGAGFENTWCDEVLKSLCMGRRVFKGQNLYVKGAAFAASAVWEPSLSEFLFLTEDMLRATISIRMFRDNRISDYPMVKAGTSWTEVDVKTVGILDDSDEVFFTVFNVVKKETKHVVMNLRNINRRENKTTRISIGVSCIDRDTAVLTVKDLGFGQFFPNTYRVWEKVISI